MDAPVAPPWMDLAGWRRTVGELYAEVRRVAPVDPRAAIARFRSERDELFRSHPQSALPPPRRETFRGLRYYPFDPAWRVEGRVSYDGESATVQVELGRDATIHYTRIGTATFRLRGATHQLMLYWIEGYGGGLFLPFRDATCGKSTFAGGRYLFDTIKGADLGGDGDRLNLDFNYAYNPSCAYDARWVCPLAPDENVLGMAVEAGEKSYSGETD